MFVFSRKVDIPVGVELGGYADRRHVTTTRVAPLEVHGFGGGTDQDRWEICAVDALYAGVLAHVPVGKSLTRVVCASHTHFAPMIDSKKPGIGVFSETAARMFGSAVEDSPRVLVSPDTCTVYCEDVAIPVYRRFDYPPGVINGFLTRHAGFFPNEQQPIDRAVTVFVFSREHKPLFAIVHHACHPVSRANLNETSADYVQALREAVAGRFGVDTCLFFLGCAADIRPNLARRRIDWMPRNRLNWRFKYPPTMDDQTAIDAQYRAAVSTARKVASFAVGPESFVFSRKQVEFHGMGKIAVPKLRIGSVLDFSFLPFEVSHRYHLDARNDGELPRTYIVSCAGDIQGYLPHPSQLTHGGYEVDSSRRVMGLRQRIYMNGSDL